MSNEITIKKTDIDKLRDKFSDYVPMFKFNDVRDEVNNRARKEDVTVLQREMITMRKSFENMCTKEEMITRLNVFNSDLNTKLQDRPTMTYFKKVLGAYDSKIESFNFA
jgi:hypothetical protein